MEATKHDIEIMAPAGSYESLHAAIKGRANSIYFGVEQLNMRARSSNNFTLEDLREIAGICKRNNMKSYITLNTVMYDHDMNLMKSIVHAAKESGISAIIAADHSVMNYARKIGFPVHISTQANISNIETVEFYAMYADVMVMARELSLMQVAGITCEIKKRNITGPAGELVRIEVFAHGALCMAVSGKCYLSLHSDFASANRGACVQNCRREYTVKDDQGNELKIDNEYIMSAADLCTIDFMDKVVEAGVSVFKIEGRGRAADYVYTTIKCYRDAGDAINAGTYTPEKFAEWKTELGRVYNRGFWDGYYLGRKMGEWSEVHGSKATTRKIFLGKGVKYFNRPGVGEFLMETHALEKGDEIMITGPTTGIVKAIIEEMWVAGETVNKVKKGDSFSIKIHDTIRSSDKLYKVLPA